MSKMVLKKMMLIIFLVTLVKKAVQKQKANQAKAKMCKIIRKMMLINKNN